MPFFVRRSGVLLRSWMVQLSRRTSYSTEAEEAQDGEHDDYGADEPDYVIHVESPSKWNESGCKQIMCGGSSGSISITWRTFSRDR
ncbi:hypothetical protein HJA78_00840 [Rhizobium bangladeshense]|nr:hypothetical protein [Rhizobium bangladeshense]